MDLQYETLGSFESSGASFHYYYNPGFFARIPVFFSEKLDFNYNIIELNVYIWRQSANPTLFTE